MKCQCRICERHREYERHMKILYRRVPARTAKFFEEMCTALDHTEMDRDVNQAIIDGSWPTSEEILAGFRKASTCPDEADSKHSRRIRHADS